jgi:glutaconate CoA-transferase subunit B
MAPANTYELMVTSAARELRDGEVVFVGIGIPNVAVNLAKRTRCPNLVLIYESGAVGAEPARLPVSIGDPALVSGATAVCSMSEVFQYYLQRGWIDVGYLGGAQVDRFGNINTTVIGDYHHPKVRLPGSGGACEIGVLAKRFVIVMQHKLRAFPERVDFVTTPGYLRGGRERERLGIAGGPEMVVTDLGILRFDADTREMILVAVHPGITLEQVRENTGWPLKAAERLETTPLPSEEELRIIREELTAAKEKNQDAGKQRS